MAEIAPMNPGSSKPAKKSRFLKVFGIIGIVLAVLLVSVYFVATSAAFFKGTILPRVSKAMNASVTVSDASISPFSSVVLKDLKIQTTGSEPLLVAPEVRLKYSLTKILGGNIKVDEVAVVSPSINVVENADGTSNLDPILKSTNEGAGKKPGPKQESKESKPLQLDITRITVTGATVTQTTLHKTGRPDRAAISGFDLTVENVKNGATGRMNTSGQVAYEKNPPVPEPGSSLKGRLQGNFTFALTQDLKPGSLQGMARVAVESATGSLAQAQGFAVELDSDATPTEIKQVLLRAEKAGVNLGEVRVSGPFDLQKIEGRLAVVASGFDKKLFNTFTAPMGMDFGSTTLASTNSLQISNAGKIITTTGGLALNSFQVTRTNQTTPSMDLKADYDLTVDIAASNATIRVFNVVATQKQAQILTGSLSQPMKIPWGGASVGSAPDSDFTARILDVNFADWRAFAGDVVPSGVLTAEAKIASRNDGKVISFDISSAIRDLAFIAASNRIDQAAISLQAAGKATDLTQFDIGSYKFRFDHRGQAVTTISGSGVYNNKSEAADLQMVMQLALANAAGLMPTPDLAISSGGADMRAHILQTTNGRVVTASLLVTNLAGKYTTNSFSVPATTADLDINMAGDLLTIRKLNGRFGDASRSGGSFGIAGDYHLTNKTTRITAGLTNINEGALAPLAHGFLGEVKLVSLTINGTTAIDYNPKAASSVIADVQVSRLLMEDPAKSLPQTPLETAFRLDAGLQKQIAEIRRCNLSLAPTSLAPTNQVDLSGRIDMTVSNAFQGSLRLAANTLDLTPYYDIYEKTSQQKAVASPAAPNATRQPGPPAAKSGPEAEPDKVTMPVTNFVAEIAIGKLYLRELQLTNMQTTVRLDGSRVAINPMKVSINGAPITSTVALDLGKPGYVYGMDFRAVQMPLTPFVNSFMPERKGQVGGTLTGVGELKGSGITGPNLRKNLSAKFDLGSTNLNLAIPSLRSQLMRTIINVIAVVPQLVKNPNAALGTLTGTLFGGGGATAQGAGNNAFMDELMNSPLDVIRGKGAIANGQVLIEDSLIQSPAFQAGARGTLVLNDVLTNSTLQIPLSVSLRRSLADKINFVPAGTPTNVAYVKLPDYVTVAGTVGEPKPKYNTAALVGTALQQIGSAIPGLDPKAGNLIQNLGNVLTGRTGTNAPQPAGAGSAPAGSTNAAPTQPSQGLGSLLQNLNSALGGNTNAPRTSQPAPAGATTATNQPRSTTESLIQGLGSILANPPRTTNAGSRTATGTNAPAKK